MILQSCISIYKLLNLWKTPLINNKDGIEIVLNIMKRLIDIQLFLYNNYNIINLDIKTDNLMIEKKNKLIIDNIINIDLGLIKTKNNNTYQFDCKYMIWPSSENIKLEKIGEGNYGLIYEISKNYVIKIFKNSLITNNINDESESIIPLNNENREISFFISYLKNKTANTNFIIDVK